ncbi:glycosyltransferase [Rhodobacterales bacterium HKCCE2091]|nr:glycosyltransferase [Rhodobacterales bacterium HKCCE2091]
MTRDTITAIMPAFRAAHLLQKTLTPLLDMRARGEIDEVLVVDDCSPDDTAEVARRMGATVMVTPRNGGPGLARNHAAAVAEGDILWFVDSDVIAQPGGPAAIRDALSEPGAVAVFGSYDDKPEGQHWFSRYKNLLHRYHHLNARREARTFWAGCGAVRKDAFLAIGGFDVETYRRPSIEDIELGYRLNEAGGRILVEPRLEGKHLKVWTMSDSLRTDIWFRALPWARLMVCREGMADDLNTGRAERLRALVALFFALSILALPFFPFAWPLVPALAALAVAVNWPLARYLHGHGGIALAARALLYHQFYYLYSASIYVWCVVEANILGRRDRFHVH